MLQETYQQLSKKPGNQIVVTYVHLLQESYQQLPQKLWNKMLVNVWPNAEVMSYSHEM